MGGHDLVRRVDRQGERMGPTLTNCCKPEQVGTKEYGQMVKRIQILGPYQGVKNWKIVGQKRRITGKDCRRLSNEFETGGFMAQKSLLHDRGALPREEGDVVREYKAMHEENFSSSWPRADVEGKEEGRKLNKVTREEVSGKRKREGEKIEDETVAGKRRCSNPVSDEAFDIFSQGEDSDICGISWSDLLGDLSDCGPDASSGVLDVLLSPSSTVVVMSEALVSDSDREVVEP